MKKVIFLIVCCACSMMLFAQQNDKYHQKAPQDVQRSWQKDYPNYNNNNESWDMRNNQWHTRYMDKDHNNRYVDVYYDKRGKRLRSESNWDRNDLPNAVRDRMRKRYHNENYKVYRIDRPGRGIFFQITWGKNNKVYFDERGREVKYY
jgi:hypothetical protein